MFRTPRKKVISRRLPSGRRIYAIGDIHGRADLLRIMLDRIETHSSRNRADASVLVFTGDYIDRGPDSRQVVDALISVSKTFETIFLKGNHEQLLIQFLSNPSVLPTWIQHGGFYTMNSYGIEIINVSNPDEREDVAFKLLGALRSAAHVKFFFDLVPSYACGDFFFAHAGVRPGIAIENQNEADLLNIRNEFLAYKGDFGKVVIHGHTPVLKPEIHPNRINIDTGAYATDTLTCLTIMDDRLDFL